MRAVGLDFERRTLELRERPDPVEPGRGEALVRVAEVGICGTDRDLARFQFGDAPDGETFLTLGHEAIGQVVAVGAEVPNLAPGDWVVPVVRRPCEPPCAQCASGRRDLCTRGRYRERGIARMHGYFSDYALDVAEDLVRVPHALADLGILLEPLSVVEKACALALRLHSGSPRTALIAGAGPIGILAGLVLLERGLRVSMISLEPVDHPRARLARRAGIAYGSDSPCDIVIEATGSKTGVALAVDRVAANGVGVLLGAADPLIHFPATRMILGNLVIAGSVNSSPASWASAVRSLGVLPRRVLEALITRRRFDEFRDTIASPPEGDIKTVHVISR